MNPRTRAQIIGSAVIGLFYFGASGGKWWALALGLGAFVQLRMIDRLER